MYFYKRLKIASKSDKINRVFKFKYLIQLLKDYNLRHFTMDS